MKNITQILIFLLAVVIIVLFYFLDPIENTLFPRCIFNSITGYYCPGCGSQRAIHHLLHLNIIGAASSNFLFIPALLFIIYHYSYKPVNKKFGKQLPGLMYYKSTPWIIIGIILLFWILRNLPFYPFNLLAPD